jgi:hypothetical protein
VQTPSGTALFKKERERVLAHGLPLLGGNPSLNPGDS